MIAGLALVVGAVVVVVVTNLIVTRLNSLDRHTRVGFATAWFLVSLTGLAWALRRLQARHVV